MQIENSVLPPLTNPDQTKEYPNDALLVFMFFMMERKWALNHKQEPIPDKNGKIWPDRIVGHLEVDCTLNLKTMIDMAQFDLEKKGIFISWKQIQMRESSIGINIFGVPDSLDISGVVQYINHELKLSQEYLINKKIISFDCTDEPIPHQNFSFRRHNESRIPPEAFAELKFFNLKIYDDKV